jgi:formamidopyrimidine-DNA glycosylase
VIAHLGMSGRLMVYDREVPPPGPHDHVDLVTDEGRTIRLRDPRRFGLMTLAETAGLDVHKLFRRLGPDPIGNAFGGEALAAALNGRATSIKAALLDQKTVAGVGNIYACEALFRAGLSPRRLAKSIQGRRAEALAQAIREVLLEAIAAGGSTLRDHVLPTGELGYFQHKFRVYGREGQPCPGCTCELARTGGIQRIVQNARSTFYCTTRQR